MGTPIAFGRSITVDVQVGKDLANITANPRNVPQASKLNYVVRTTQLLTANITNVVAGVHYQNPFGKIGKPECLHPFAISAN